MDETWLSVSDAAAELGLSVGRVRNLVQSGALAGRKIGGSWFVDPVSVQRRSRQSRAAGRPLSPDNAWRLLFLIGHDMHDDPASGSMSIRWRTRLPFEASAVERSRLRALLADLPGPEGLSRRLAARASIRRMRVHVGVLDRLVADPSVSVGGGRAVASRGGGVAAGGLDRLYVQERDLDAVVRRYRLRDDVEGNVEIAVIPESVDREVLPEPGSPVSLSVAWTDLLDDVDVRARGAARAWAEALPRHLVQAGSGRR